jgi:hypothetical protein
LQNTSDNSNINALNYLDPHVKFIVNSPTPTLTLTPTPTTTPNYDSIVKKESLIRKNSPITIHTKPIDESIYINRKFNWIHYLILNYDLFVNENINTPQKAFEHWSETGMRERRKSIIYDQEPSEYLYTYTLLKNKIPSIFLDENIENKLKNQYTSSDRELFKMHPTLFHKYLLNLRNPNDRPYIQCQNKTKLKNYTYVRSIVLI